MQLAFYINKYRIGRGRARSGGRVLCTPISSDFKLQKGSVEGNIQNKTELYSFLKPIKSSRFLITFFVPILLVHWLVLLNVFHNLFYELLCYFKFRCGSYKLHANTTANNMNLEAKRRWYALHMYGMWCLI